MNISRQKYANFGKQCANEPLFFIFHSSFFTPHPSLVTFHSSLSSCLPPGGRGTAKRWKEQAGAKSKHIALHSAIAYLSLTTTGECSPHPPLRGPPSPPGKALKVNLRSRGCRRCKNNLRQPLFSLFGPVLMRQPYLWFSLYLFFLLDIILPPGKACRAAE